MIDDFLAKFTKQQQQQQQGKVNIKDKIDKKKFWEALQTSATSSEQVKDGVAMLGRAVTFCPKGDLARLADMHYGFARNLNKLKLSVDMMDQIGHCLRYNPEHAGCSAVQAQADAAAARAVQTDTVTSNKKQEL